MKQRNVSKIWIPIIALLICGVVVLLERYGVTSEYLISEQEKQQNFTFTEAVWDEAECLILTSAKDEVSGIYEEMITFVLDDMRVPYDVLEVSVDAELTGLDQYKTLVITFEDWSILGDNLLVLCDWVKEGGGMMNMSTPVPNASFQAVSGKLGIEYGGTEYVGISGFQVMNDCMIGGTEGETYSFVTEGERMLEVSLGILLNSSCETLLLSEDGKVPLLWKCDYGEGTFVIFNEVITDKYQRGFASLAYSMLEDISIYPVINASAFYLDDFPSPVPGGDGEYIKRDYGVSVASFYSTIWWPKVLTWAEKYGIRYTGLIIELYSDDVQSPFVENTEVAQFTTYGNMLLNAGGELGFHGYNHMPLCVEGTDEELQYGDYNLWPSQTEIKEALKELTRFAEGLFPDSTFTVYVPPSNILSETGKEALLETCPDVKIIASTYLPDADSTAYVQEFEVDEDGMIHTPRVTSSLEPDSYQRIVALTEMNLHYVQSHFMHPDDLLDEDRGAAKGFQKLSESFESYLEWVYTSAPDIRNVTGSEMGTAVLQYDQLSMKREWNGNVLSVRLGGFSGEAYFLMRIKEGSLAGTEGCTYENVTGDIYVVHATSDEIKIYLGE